MPEDLNPDKETSFTDYEGILREGGPESKVRSNFPDRSKPESRVRSNFPEKVVESGLKGSLVEHAAKKNTELNPSSEYESWRGVEIIQRDGGHHFKIEGITEGRNGKFLFNLRRLDNGSSLTLSADRIIKLLDVEGSPWRKA